MTKAFRYLINRADQSLNPEYYLIIHALYIIVCDMIKWLGTRHGVNSILSIPMPHQIYQFQFQFNVLPILFYLLP